MSDFRFDYDTTNSPVPSKRASPCQASILGRGMKVEGPVEDSPNSRRSGAETRSFPMGQFLGLPVWTRPAIIVYD